MYSRRRKRTQKFIYSGFIIVLCLLAVGVAWPFGEKNEDNSSAVSHTGSSYETESKTEIREEKNEEQIHEDEAETEEKETGIIESFEAYYLVKRNGDSISIYYCTDGQMIELETTGIVYDVLGPEDQKLFDEGIKISSQEELGILLQDFGS